ncbi:MAG: hypothetical protein Q8S20_01860 [Sulfuritalea sp.]|nr:hypothetical protein [Sulfuritalea sp.]
MSRGHWRGPAPAAEIAGRQICAANECLDQGIEFDAGEGMQALIRIKISRRLLGGPVQIGSVGARGFLHSDLPSWRNEAGDDRDAVVNNRHRPFCTATYYI